MPYSHAKMKMPRQYDRRVKYTEADKEKVRRMYHVYHVPKRAIARETGMNRTNVDFILFPEKLARAKAMYKERRKDGRYYDRAKHTKAIREHGRYKQKLKINGKLQNNET
jgi:hypothetical protein